MTKSSIVVRVVLNAPFHIRYWINFDTAMLPPCLIHSSNKHIAVRCALLYMVIYTSTCPVIRYRLLVKDWHKYFWRDLSRYLTESVSPVRNLFTSKNFLIFYSLVIIHTFPFGTSTCAWVDYICTVFQTGTYCCNQIL